MTAVPPGDASKAHNATLFRNRTTPKDTRQHSPCRRCFSDCISDDITARLAFTCTNCGHTHTNTRGDVIRHGAFLARYATGSEPNR